MRPTRAEVNLTNVAHNIRQVREKVGAETRVMAVVKADGYGHGAVKIAQVALRTGAQWLAVATVEEGVQLREEGINAPILVLGPSFPQQAQLILRHRLSQVVCDKRLVEALSKEARSSDSIARVQVKVDTGMGRLGIMPDEAADFAQYILRLGSIRTEGILTHFSVADEDKDFTHWQIKRFKRAVSSLEKENIFIPLKHAANSAAIMNIPSSYLNLVRPGIMLYGLYPSSQMRKTATLKPAMSLKTRIAYLKTVPPGYSLSYGRTFITRKKSRIATLPVGYADGYPRALSNQGQVLIKGKRAPVVGRVCMDMILIEVTHIPSARMGDEVVLFGRQGKEEISVDELAQKAGTINYEIVCGVSKRVPRIYIN